MIITKHMRSYLRTNSENKFYKIMSCWSGCGLYHRIRSCCSNSTIVTPVFRHEDVTTFTPASTPTVNNNINKLCILCTYIYIHTYIIIIIYVHTNIAYNYTYIHTFMYIHTYNIPHAYIYYYIHTYVYTYIYIYTYTLLYTYTSYIYIHLLQWNHSDISRSEMRTSMSICLHVHTYSVLYIYRTGN